jgi:hypothetical protein
MTKKVSDRGLLRIIQLVVVLSVLISALTGCLGDKSIIAADHSALPSQTPTRDVYRGGTYHEQQLEGWNIRCQKDPSDNSKYCSSVKRDLRVGVLQDQAGSFSYRVILGDGNIYPGSEQTLQIDNDPPLSADQKGFDDTTSREIIERMQKATQVKVRYRTREGGYAETDIAVGRFYTVVSHIHQILQSL